MTRLRYIYGFSNKKIKLKKIGDFIFENIQKYKFFFFFFSSNITNENILLRGTTLKLSPVIYGCAIYTGRDTKMMKNSKFKSNKLSCVEK